MTDEDAKKRLLPPEKAREIDHQLRGQLAVATRGVSPVDVAAAVVDWAGHLVLSPGKLLSLAESVARNGVELAKINSVAMKPTTAITANSKAIDIYCRKSGGIWPRLKATK